MSYNTKDILNFFRDHNPSYIKMDDNTWSIFTVPTQWKRGFETFEDAIEYTMKFIKNGKWKPGESSFSRFIDKIEKSSEKRVKEK